MVGQPETVGKYWIGALVSIFFMGIVILVINPIIIGKFIPALLDGATVNLPADQVAQIAAKYHTWELIIRWTPFAITFACVVYIIASIFMKERTEQYYG